MRERILATTLSHKIGGIIGKEENIIPSKDLNLNYVHDKVPCLTTNNISLLVSFVCEDMFAVVKNMFNSPVLLVIDYELVHDGLE